MIENGGLVRGVAAVGAGTRERRRGLRRKRPSSNKKRQERYSPSRSA